MIMYTVARNRIACLLIETADVVSLTTADYRACGSLQQTYRSGKRVTVYDLLVQIEDYIFPPALSSGSGSRPGVGFARSSF